MIMNTNLFVLKMIALINSLKNILSPRVPEMILSPFRQYRKKKKLKNEKTMDGWI